mmetsp:Transcript_29724/g.36091  ORF Transcript_29724/g.36091 Transcript_29724/m.36091 type:complete len:536 (-) Transcript_29724:537-2144(-)
MEHEQTYGAWFRQADADHDGRVTGQDAVAFFAKSGLPKDVLAKVWALGDTGRQGYLGKKEFLRSMAAISLAQNGQPLTLENVEQSLASSGQPLAMMQGLEAANTAEANPFSDPFKEAFKVPESSTAAPVRSSWFGSSNKNEPKVNGKVCSGVVDGLRRIYLEKLKPIEAAFKFDAFYGPLLGDADFEAKPSVLLLGQYSTGKTTFIKHLLKREYPGTHIGPEPTTDRFVVVMGGMDERRTPGNTLAVQTDKPYQGLTTFGTAFLSKFEAAQCPHPLLEEITLVDTPGVLSGEKQRLDRSYDFIGVVEWFAARCDVILLLFDPHKLDISDEFKAAISTLKGHEDKVRVVLNKSDQVDMQQLMRVYGALMWSLGKVFNNPEVCRVYVGSFNTSDIATDKNPNGVELFKSEQGDLMKDLYEIPKRSCDRKVNEFVKRVRSAKIHCLILGHLRKQMPSMMGKQAKQDKLIDRLEDEFHKVQLENHLPVGDFPNCRKFKEVLRSYDLSKFPKFDKKMLKTFDDVLELEIPKLLKTFDNPF